MKSLILRTTFLAMAMFSFHSAAHVRWFVPVGTELPDMTLPLDWISGIVTAGAIGFILSVFVVKFLADRFSKIATFVYAPIERTNNIEWYILFGLVNMLFLHNLMLGDFLGPHYFLPEQYMMVGVVLQALILIGSVISLAFTGAVLIVIALLGIVLFSFESGIDYFFEMLSLGLAYLFISTKLNSNDNLMFKRFGLDRFVFAAPVVLRIGLGIQLISLALHNKIFEPAATYYFLLEHPYYNFLHYFGWTDFSHLHFAYAAGIFESCFGLMLTLGICNRYVICVIAFFFVSTGVISGLEEVIGHLPIFGFIAVLVTVGEHGLLGKRDEQVKTIRSKNQLNPPTGEDAYRAEA